jgi:hypothetical protein
MLLTFGRFYDTIGDLGPPAPPAVADDAIEYYTTGVA